MSRLEEKNNSVRSERDVDQLVQQSMRYANDLAEIYSAEKARRKELEKLNAELKNEIEARKSAEKELRLAQEKLEERVRERTKQLTHMNQSLSKEIQERKGAQQKVLEQLQEKDALLSEIHHRVKNNLQIISSLLMLQELRTEDQTTLEILGDCQNRIRSMALIHERLYYARDLSRIDFHSYLEELAVELLRAQATDSRIRLVSDLDEVVVGVKTAFPCGLIVNELVSNCVKHAFNSSMDGEIRLSLKHDPDEGFELKVSDNGKGLPEDNDFSETPTLGLKLVRNLAEKQLKGKLSIGGDNGAEIRLTFPDQGMEANDGGRENGQGQCDDS